MAGISEPATKESSLVGDGANSSEDVLTSKEAMKDDVSITEEKPQYPSGIMLYLIVMALMLSMFLVGVNSNPEISFIRSR